jgi:RNA polymerase sigma-70 factor (ECF subfamily)
MYAQQTCPTSDLLDRIVALRPVLLRSACQVVGQPDADDLVQGTIERCLTHLDHFRPDTNLLAWMRRIMSNLMIDGWRHQGRMLLDGRTGQDLAAPSPHEPPPWSDLNMEDIKRAVAGLPDRFRAVFTLHYFDGLTYAAIGVRLNIPPSTVGTRLLRARKQVYARLLTERSRQAGGLAAGLRGMAPRRAALSLV